MPQICFSFWHHDSQELTCSPPLSQYRRFDRRRQCSILGRCSNRENTGRCTSNTVRPCMLVTTGKNSTPFTLNLKQRACKITCPCHIISSRRVSSAVAPSYCNNYTFRDVWSIYNNRLYYYSLFFAIFYYFLKNNFYSASLVF